MSSSVNSLNKTLGEELLRVHKSYLPLINVLKENVNVKGMAHITGGGIEGNTKRIIPDGLKFNIHWGSWEVPTIFKLIGEAGEVDNEDMRKVFNMGIGLAIVIARDDEELTLQLALEMKEHPLVIGEIE